VSGELVRELESLDKALPLKIGQLSLTGHSGGLRQLTKSFAKALQTLAPTDIGIRSHKLNYLQTSNAAANLLPGPTLVLA